MEVVPLSDAKDRLSAIVSEITSTHAHYTITRNGTPAVALLPIDDLQALEETIFWLEREITRLRAGDLDEAGPDINAEEMAELMRQRHRRETGAA
jgi:prevent-host-death family protein